MLVLLFGSVEFDEPAAQNENSLLAHTSFTPVGTIFIYMHIGLTLVGVDESNLWVTCGNL